MNVVCSFSTGRRTIPNKHPVIEGYSLREYSNISISDITSVVQKEQAAITMKRIQNGAPVRPPWLTMNIRKRRLRETMQILCKNRIRPLD